MKDILMKYCYKILLFICLIGLNSGRVEAQQNIQFSQYIFNTLSVNPAYAGYKEEWFVQSALRNQWVGLDGAPKTGQISIDGILDPQTTKHGVGFQITADKLGAQSSTSATLNYAFRLQLDGADTRRLSFGLGMGVAQYSLNGSALTTVDGNDQAVPLGNASNLSPDFRVGIYYTTPYWYVGLSALDLLSNTSSVDDYRRSSTYSDNIVRTRHMYFVAGSLINASPGLRFRPSMQIREDFKGPTNADFNAMAIFNDRIWLGAGYRTSLKLFKKEYQNTDVSRQAALIGIAQFYVNERFRIGYSYDYAVSKLSGYQSGTHELTVGIAFGKAPKASICPRVF
jgi:type IX secretion system PorP/SprF family membrane protein